MTAWCRPCAVQDIVFQPAFNALLIGRRAGLMNSLLEYLTCWNGCRGKGWCWSCYFAASRLSSWVHFWLPALVFAGIGNGTAYLAFLEFIAPFMVAVGGS